MPEDIQYWRAYLEALNYAHGIFKDDGLMQMQLLK